MVGKKVSLPSEAACSKQLPSPVVAKGQSLWLIPASAHQFSRPACSREISDDSSIKSFSRNRRKSSEICFVRYLTIFARSNDCRERDIYFSNELQTSAKYASQGPLGASHKHTKTEDGQSSSCQAARRLKWSSITRKHNGRWQHQSRVKDVLFPSWELFLSWEKRSRLPSRTSSTIYSWWSPIGGSRVPSPFTNKHLGISFTLIASQIWKCEGVDGRLDEPSGDDESEDGAWSGAPGRIRRVGTCPGFRLPLVGWSPFEDFRHRHRKIVLNFGPVVGAKGTILEILNSKAVTVVAKCLLTDAEDPGSIPGDHSNLLPLSATLSLDVWHFLLAYLYLPARLA